MSKLAAAILTCAALLSASFCGTATAQTASTGVVPVVAAENFYGDVAQQVGGPNVAVTSILSNPDQDPHLF
ncbi:MAG TPA: cation ABC transporter substrate-binding protein, partial [Caballeronia sp.]|nr:cation ABC transporter substrate-binding protein [Caballeronia sp.]